MIAVSQLTDEQAISAANFVVQEWGKVAGLEALKFWQAIEKVRKTQEPIEAWVADPKSNDPEVAKLYRQMLQFFLERPRGTEPDFQKWARQGIDNATQAHAQVLDPIGGGLLLIGLVLAVRIESIGPGGVKFFKGLPESLIKLVNAASSMVTFS